jgi:hypothetical protein
MKNFKIFSILIALVLFLNSCANDEVTIPDTITLTAATMQNQTSSQSVNLTWSYVGDVSTVVKYVVQYSLHHGQWLDFQDVMNQNATNFVGTSTVLNPNHTYAWRVKAVKANEEIISCYRECYLPLLPNIGGVFGTVKLHTTAYTTNGSVEFDFTPFNTSVFQAGIHPVLEKKTGTTWTLVLDMMGSSSLVSGFFTAPQAAMTVGETYRVYIHGQELYYGKSNALEFTYSNPFPNNCCETEIVARPTVQSVVMQPQMVNRRLNIQWLHPNPGSLLGFKVQYALHHSRWIDFQTVNNQTFSIDNLYPQNFNPNGALLTNTKYKWRVVALGANCEAVSCSKEAYLNMGVQEQQGRPMHLEMVGDFTAGQNLNLKMTASIAPNLQNWEYQVQSYNGANWVNQGPAVSIGTIASLPHSFSVPMASLSGVLPYQIVVRKQNTSMASNAIVFYNKAPEIEAADCL